MLDNRIKDVSLNGISAFHDNGLVESNELCSWSPLAQIHPVTELQQTRDPPFNRGKKKQKKLFNVDWGWFKDSAYYLAKAFSF